MSPRTPVMKADRIIGVLTIGAVIITAWITIPKIGNLDQDNALIDRGQELNNCIGDRSDLIDDWRAIVLQEFLIQVENVSVGNDVDVSVGLAGELAIRRLVQERRQIRSESRRLIAAEETDFTCPPVDPALIPPPPDK